MRKKLNIEFYIQQMFQDKRVFVYSIAASHFAEALFIEKLKNVVDSQNKGSVHDLINISLFATSTYDRAITAEKFVESNKISYFPVSSISFGPNGNLHPLPLEITEDQIPSGHTVFANFNFKEGEIKNKVIFGNNEVQLITKTFNVTFNLIDNNFVLHYNFTTFDWDEI